jgi:hypothetical protein
MRESQMKKIIAAAVATAFVAPVMAADVTLSGDLEYVFTKYEKDGTAASVGDTDIAVAASETAGDIAISAVVHLKQGASEGEVALAGSFGTIAIGDTTDNAAQAIDEKAGVAEFELGDSATAPATSAAATVLYTLPTIVDGLSLHVSYGASAGTNDNADTNEANVSSYSATYTVGNVTVGYGSIDDSAKTFDMNVMNATFTSGPISVAYELSENDGGVANTDVSGLGLTYNYGPGKIFVESQTTDTNGVETNDTGVGVSYKIGSVNMYIQSNSGDTTADNGKFVGVEYAF